MTYKNARIKDIREAIIRLMDGEVFYCGEEKIYFDVNELGSPFLTKSAKHGIRLIDNLFDQLKDWQIAVDWRDTVSKENPVLCWVSTVDDSCRDLQLVTYYEKNNATPLRYRTNMGWWSKAKPVKLDEIKQYILEE